MTPSADRPRPAALTVINPSGHRSRVAIETLPFDIGRQTDNHLVLRDNRASRRHARIGASGGHYFIEDLESRNGVTVNGSKVSRARLANGDRIEFGIQDSYTLVFSLEEDELHRLMDQVATAQQPATTGAANMAKLRALVEVARALQHSLSTKDVLGAVVEAALTVTGSDRGFLLLRRGEELEVAVARDKGGTAIDKQDLRVPTRIISRALRQRRELLSMNFDPLEQDGVRPELTVADLELRSVVCVPLVRVRRAATEETAAFSTLNETVGLLYLDSRQAAADLTAGNRELLQTLALEASTILENARLLEEERTKQKLEEELNVARTIQTSLLPRRLPGEGWFRAAGSSVPSHQVGGDYFDVKPIGNGAWCAVIADVSGKGVSSALLASLLQGAFLLASVDPVQIRAMLRRINAFLNERTGGEKYATVFYCAIEAGGRMWWSNAGHCQGLLLKPNGTVERLRTNGLPLGLMALGDFVVEERQLAPGDKLVLYTDGVSEAQNAEGQFFDKRLRETVRARAASGCGDVHDALMKAVEAFTEGAEQSDDMTALVVEYLPVVHLQGTARPAGP